MTRFCLFDTAVGRCAIAWAASGVVAVQLPESDDERTRGRILRRHPDALETAPDAPMQHAIGLIRAMLRGAPEDCCGIQLDMSGVPEFHRRVYEIARTIRPGSTMTYGAIAERLGGIGLARAVGQALGRNPFAPVVPCHRVLATGGKIGGFSASGGAALKTRMLIAECARPDDEPSLFDGPAPLR